MTDEHKPQELYDFVIPEKEERNVLWGLLGYMVYKHYDGKFEITAQEIDKIIGNKSPLSFEAMMTKELKRLTFKMHPIGQAPRSDPLH